MGVPAKHRIYRGLSRLLAALPGGPPAGLRVLIYHSVGGALLEDRYGTAISREDFAAHVERLAALRRTWETAHFACARDGLPRLAVTFDDGYRDVLTVAAPILARHAIPFTLFATTGFIRSGSPLYLTPAELNELSRLPGARIGSHGATHRRLDSLGDADLAEELSASRKYLQDLLGAEVNALSYPHGSVDRRVRDAARAAGYAFGGTSRYGLNGPGRDPLLLCRTEVVAWDTPRDLELKVSGAWDWYALRHRDPQRA